MLLLKSDEMNINDFDYKLPKELIAQSPMDKRSDSKLLLMDKLNGNLSEDIFSNIINYFNKGDVLVLNNTKVLPARLNGIKEITNAKIEIFLLNNIKDNTWKCLGKPLKRLNVGDVVSFSNDFKCIIKDKRNNFVEVEFIYKGEFIDNINKYGEVPLPPYINEKLDDDNKYQTVYAKELGSVAAPTAGLHFTYELLDKIKDKGVQILYVTLHVGIGTFKPVEEEDITKHKMHSEYFEISEEVVNKLNLAKLNNYKIYAVGTTTCRVLESVYKNNNFISTNGNTNIFIYPGYKFNAIDGLITNFHLPKSSLLMLVSALSSLEYIKKAYNFAINNNYRFFSFGDAMFIK